MAKGYRGPKPAKPKKRKSTKPPNKRPPHLESVPSKPRRVGPTYKNALALLDAGLSVREIANELDVSTQRVYAIIKTEREAQGYAGRGQDNDEAPKPVRDDTEDRGK